MASQLQEERLYTFRYEVQRNVFPPLERTIDIGSVRASDAPTALKNLVESYNRPSFLYSVQIMDEEKPTLVLAMDYRGRNGVIDERVRTK